MNKKDSEWEQLFLKLKKEFDSLLQKNQNDLVKIRIREKNLNDKIVAIQLERQQEVRRLKEEIAILRGRRSIQKIQQPKRMDTKNEEIVSLLKSLKSKDQQIEKLKQDNKRLSSNNISLQQQIIALNVVAKESKQAYQIISEQKNTEENTIDNLQRDNDRQRMLIKKLSQQEKNQVQKLEMKGKQIQIILKKLEQVESRSIDIVKCLRCTDLEQQLQLQKQMLKSVKMMLKLKEMELENLNK